MSSANLAVIWRCINYISILDETPGFNGLGKDNCTTRRETFKFRDLVLRLSKIWRYVYSYSDTGHWFGRVGLETGAVTVAQISASSTLPGYPINKLPLWSHRGLNDGGMWKSAAEDATPWVEVNLWFQYNLRVIQVQGGGPHEDCYVKTMKMQYFFDGAVVDITRVSNRRWVWAWWRHQMETISALLALCAGNSPVTCEFRA